MVKVDFKNKKTLILLGVLLLSILAGAYLFLRNNKDIARDDDTLVTNTEEVETPDIVTESVEVPDESEPKEFYVPPDLPKYIIIPSINVRGYIQSVSVDQDGLIAVPTNVHLAGWYINSVKPGKEGLSIIDGHRDGSTIGGIFRNLETLSKGDSLSVEYGDGTIYDFEVVDLERLSIEDSFDFMYSRIDGVDVQLNLVTCGGKWSKEINTYEDRIIVRAKGV
jgi:LPXTG-site transpeptidase (sortase) family protein